MYDYQRHRKQQNEDEDRITAEIMNIKLDNPDYGYRRVILPLNSRHLTVNHKKVQRIKRAEGLQSMAYTKRIRKHSSY
ncbi:IS3 family transposase [Sporolactobacillus sp. THM19-2]|uniref:IS3 family transposase n=1 Tax=Sporolactobacillus sp. THM19-2 TaxID=2511171 RepID=UPI0013EC86BE|nr:IS3 family transposase [Sporolactobacillus sp. THM19-2]